MRGERTEPCSDLDHRSSVGARGMLGDGARRARVDEKVLSEAFLRAERQLAEASGGPGYEIAGGVVLGRGTVAHVLSAEVRRRIRTPRLRRCRSPRARARRALRASAPT